jgi:hypothetical protein
MQQERNKKSRGIQQRIGYRLYHEIEAIKDKRLTSGKSRKRVSTVKISNLITRNKFWKQLSEDIISASEEEVNQYGVE